MRINWSVKEKKDNVCPLCNNMAKNISKVTLESFLKEEEQNKLLSLEGFYFCKTSSCKVIYFRKELIFKDKHLTKEIGLKDWTNPSTVCYCFNWTVEKIQKDISCVISDIKSQMNTDKCACEISNPSGSCCLKDVKEVIRKLDKNLNI
jgi:hypothetical protein